MLELLKLIATFPVMFARAVVLDREERAELAHIHASTRRWLDEQPVTAAQPDTLDRERYLGALLSATRIDVERLQGDVVRLTDERDILDDELLQRTRERDAARAYAKVQDNNLLQRVVQLGKVTEEIRRLREDLAHAPNQQGTPAMGEIVTLRLENGTTVTGPLFLNCDSHRMVRGWHVDCRGRSLVPTPNGGE